jgi:hypothetical protein
LAPPRVPACNDGDPRVAVDVVYTWVDDHDPTWHKEFVGTLRSQPAGEVNGQAANAARFRNRDELRYSLRSLVEHAPFVRRVYIVTAGQVPPWLDETAPNVRVVPHKEILDAECLPTFNSHAIETRLHHIDGLAEHYLYLNDDFFFAGPCRPSMFFTADGRSKVFPDVRATIPSGPALPGDRPVDSASKNTRDLIRAEFGMLVEHKIQHVPYPQRRSLLFEMEERFPVAFKQTARNPFRHHTDVNVASCLSHHYALAVGGGIRANFPASYINIAKPWAPMQLRRLLRVRDRGAFCLNDSEMSRTRGLSMDAAVGNFLRSYFPMPSPFEVTHVASR